MEIANVKQQTEPQGNKTREMQSNQKTKGKEAVVSLYISIVTLNVNALKSPKRVQNNRVG